MLKRLILSTALAVTVAAAAIVPSYANESSASADPKVCGILAKYAGQIMRFYQDGVPIELALMTAKAADDAVIQAALSTIVVEIYKLERFSSKRDREEAIAGITIGYYKGCMRGA